MNCSCIATILLLSSRILARLLTRFTFHQHNYHTVLIGLRIINITLACILQIYHTDLYTYSYINTRKYIYIYIYIVLYTYIYI